MDFDRYKVTLVYRDEKGDRKEVTKVVVSNSSSDAIRQVKEKTGVYVYECHTIRVLPRRSW